MMNTYILTVLHIYLHIPMYRPKYAPTCICKHGMKYVSNKLWDLKRKRGVDANGYVSVAKPASAAVASAAPCVYIPRLSGAGNERCNRSLLIGLGLRLLGSGPEPPCTKPQLTLRHPSSDLSPKVTGSIKVIAWEFALYEHNFRRGSQLFRNLR